MVVLIMDEVHFLLNNFAFFLNSKIHLFFILFDILNLHLWRQVGKVVYDLYSVSNHIGGNLRGGHYTAMAKNRINKNWSVDF